MSDDANRPAKQWTRDAPWRQGSILTQEAVRVALGREPEPENIYVVLTHDCDCIQDTEREPKIELIKGRWIEAAKAELTHNRNPRTLHLNATRHETPAVLEIKIGDRLTIDKLNLLAFEPDREAILHDSERLTLVRWVASRYTRAALPDALVDRLAPIKETIKKIGNRHPFAIVGIYLDYDPLGEIISDDEPYEVRIAVVYDSAMSGAEEEALEAARTLRSRFERKFHTVETEHAGLQWHLIELTYCEAVADTLFSLRSAIQSKLYQLDYISLAQDPPADIPSDI